MSAFQFTRGTTGEPVPAQALTCLCRQCLHDQDLRLGGFPAALGMMVLCALCGNKRCPHATDHRQACTGSNAPGQPGSVYGPPAA